MEGERKIEVEVERSPSRCPYCHDAVIASEEDWLACADCLARHHDDCWRELGRCSSCGSKRSLALDAPSSIGSVTTIAPRERTARLSRKTREAIHAVLVSFILGAGIAAAVLLWQKLGCFVLFVVFPLGNALDRLVKALLGLGKKRRKRAVKEVG